MQNQIEVIIDNAGGITVQTQTFVGGYSHRSEITGCANDLRALLDGEDPTQWEGNRPDERCNADCHPENLVLTGDEIAAILAAGKAIEKVALSRAAMDLVADLLQTRALHAIEMAS